MDIDFYSDNHFNIKDIKDIFKRLNKDKKISRSVIEFAYSYNKDKTKDITDGMLTIFDKVDSKGKIKDEIEIGELAEFLDEVVKAAGDDMDLSKEEAEAITSKMSDTSGDKKVTSEHLFNFLRVLQVNMEPPVITKDTVTLDEIIVTPNGSYYRDSIYQNGQIVSIDKNEFGKVNTWIDLAKLLYKEDGFDESAYTSVEWNRRANELRELNGGKPLEELKRVNVQLSNQAILNNKEKLLNSFEIYMDNMALPLAEKISKIVSNSQTTDSLGKITELFDNNEINSDNIVPLFNMYLSDKHILNGDTSLLDAIMSETAFLATTRTEVRQMQKALLERIIKLINKAAEDAGVEPAVIEQFSNGLSGQLSNIFIWADMETLTSEWDDGMKKEKFEGTIKSYIATIISAKRVKEIDDPLALADKAVGDNKVILDNLSEMYKNYDDDQGWFSNFVDGVTGLFGARTRGDIEKLLVGSKKDLDELETAIKAKNYKKFKEAYLKCFGMPFDPRVIQAQNEVGTKLALVGMANNLQLAICQDTKQNMLKYVDDSMKKVIDEQCIATYGKSMQACSDAELKSVLQSFYDIYSQIRDGILSVTPKSKLESDYERLTAASPMLIVQNQVESYMQNQSTCVACAEIVGDIVATALIPGGSLLLLGKLGRWGYKAKNVINIACKVMDGNGKLAVARNVLKTGAVVYANHRLTYGQNALESLKAAGEMSLFGLVGFGNSTLARLLINSSKFPSIAKFGQDAASMLGDAAFMELFNKVSGNDLNLAQDLTQFLAIYILGKLMHSAVNGENKLTKDEQDLMNKIVKELGLPEGASQLKTSHLLTYAKKNIKDSKLVKSIEKFLKNNDKKPNSQDLLHGNENFYKDFLKTGKPYEIAECEDGTYILRFKDNSLNTGDKYTYCVLDKNMKLVAKHENLTPNDAAQKIENHDSLKFEYHSQNSNPVYVSFDAGLLETVTKMIKRLYSQHKCKTLMNKIDKINETLNFYGLKEGDLKALSETEMNKLIENLDIFEAATQNMSKEQLEVFSKLFRENPDSTKDLATTDALSLVKKLGIDKLNGGKDILSNIENSLVQAYTEEVENITTIEELNEFRERIDKGELPKRLLGLVSQKELLLRLRELFPDEAEYNKVIESCRRKNGSLDQNKIKATIKDAENNPEIKRLRDELKKLVPNEEEFNELVGQCKTPLNYEQAINYINLRDEIIKISSRSKIEGFWDRVDHTKLTMEQKQILRNMLDDLEYFYELNKYVKDPDVWNRMCKDARLDNGFIDIVKLDEAVTLHLFEGYINNAKTKQDCVMIRRLMDETAMTSETRAKLSTQLHLKNDEVFDSEDWGAGYHDSDFNVMRQKAYERAGVWDDRLMVGKPRATGATNAIFEQLKSYNRELTKYAPNIAAVGESGIRGRNIVTLTQKVFNHAKKLGLKCIIDLRDDSSDIRIKIGDVEHFKFPISYDGSSDEIVLKNLTGFFKRMDDGNFYIGCTQGSHRTDVALALNFALNKNCTYIPELLFLKRMDVASVIKRIYNKVLSLTPEQRQAYGITDEVIRNMPASEAELDMRIKQIRD